jgi:hypothetical protein
MIGDRAEPRVQIAAMGFPAMWIDSPLWATRR